MHRCPANSLRGFARALITLLATRLRLRLLSALSQRSLSDNTRARSRASEPFATQYSMLEIPWYIFLPV